MNTRHAPVCLFAGLVVAVHLFAPPGGAQECPERVHRWGGPAVTVAWSGSHALVANWDALQVVDVSDPTTPRVIGEVGLPHAWVTDLAMSDGYAYVGHAEGLQIIDVSSPTSPAGVGLVEIPHVRKVAVSGHRAYVLHDRTLSIVDVSDPANPVRIGFLDRLWGTRGLAASGDYAYLATYVGNQPSLRVIDVSTPENPTEAAVITFPERGWPAVGVDENPVAVSGDLAFLLFVSYAGDPALFFVVDISTPTDPIKLGYLSTHTGVAWVGNMVVSGEFVYAGDGVIVDVSDPANPVEGGRLGEVGAVAVSGRYAYQAVDFQGLRVLDVSDPASPVEVGSLRTYADAVTVSGSQAYVAIRGGGLRVLDASEPYDPVEVGRCDLPPQSYVHSIEVAGDHAFVAAGGAGLRIIEISDPENPREVGAVAADGWTAHVAVSDGRALVHDGSRNGGPGEAVRIIDVSDPSHPTQLGSYDGLNRVSGLAVSGDIAFVSTRPDGLRVLDISNPATPVEVSFVPAPWSSGGVAVLGNYAYLGDSSVGVRILDISDAARPVEVGASACLTAGIEVSGRFAYCHGEWGDTDLGVIDVSTPTIPLRAGFYETRTDRDVRPYSTPRRFNDFPGSISQAAVAGGSVYLAAGRLEILDAGCLNTRWLGIAAHLDGRHSSHWRTDVVALNTGASDADVTLTLHLGVDELTATASIAASTQGVFEDIVGAMGASGKGPIEIRSDQPLAIAGRIYSEAESGTYGQHIDSGPAWKGLEAGESGTLLGLRQHDGRFRTNLSVTNLGTETASVSVSLHGTDGSELAN